MTGPTKYSGAWRGAAVGALLTVALIILFFLGTQAVGLPFAPFDAFDWVARVLPGAVITAGIDAMVAAIRTLEPGDLSGAAKAAEQTMAVGLTLAAGVVVGFLFFGWFRRRGPDSPHHLAAGLVLGALAGAAALAMSLGVNESSATGPVVNSLWILALFAGWGACLGWAHGRLVGTKASPGANSFQGAAYVEALDRRRFMVHLGTGVAVLTVAGGGVAAWLGSRRRGSSPQATGTPWSETHRLPNADAGVEPVRGTRPELTPLEDHYRIDINTRPPVVAESDWRLTIGGLVDQPGEWTLAQLREGYEPLHQFVTLACISNPIGGSLTSTQRWTGVPLRRLLEEVGPGADATHLRIDSADDFFEILRLDDALADDRIMLTYAWDGLPLATGHGFPVRIYIPDRYGMKQPKWIESIQLMDHDEEGYWVRRGWDKEARMRARSIIDTVGTDMMIGEVGEATVVPIGGMAHAGARGISRVEVRVDDGPWNTAQIREPLSDTTWVLWRYDWPFQTGDHTLTVRCFEADGTPQIARRSPVRPSGATGLHHEEIML